MRPTVESRQCWRQEDVSTQFSLGGFLSFSPCSPCSPWFKTNMKRGMLIVCQVGLLVGVFALWHVLTATETLPKFFFGEPLVVLARVRDWFVSGKIYPH